MRAHRRDAARIPFKQIDKTEVQEMKLTYQNEQEIADLVKGFVDSEIGFFPGHSELGQRALTSLRGGSLKRRERPDFEDVSHSLLLESMIVDDHPRIAGKDATRAREGAVLRELRNAGFGEMFPNASLVANVDTGLPAAEDHNYRAYLDQFTAVVTKHAAKTGAYRAQRPGFDLGFLILDESTAYLENRGAFGRAQSGRLHAWFDDAGFLRVIRDAGIDLALWLTPYKHVTTVETGRFPLPKLSIIDVGLLSKHKPQHYDERRMVSSEK